MTDFQAEMTDFAARQAEREARVRCRIEHLKQVVIPPLQTAGIARIEICFDGCGDSGAVEECVSLDAAGEAADCPDLAVERYDAEHRKANGEEHSQPLGEALETLTYLALERHHPGWEINDGACGELVIDVAEASFVLDCQLRFIAADDHAAYL